MYAVGITKSYLSASRGTPKKVENFVPELIWKGQLLEFCEKFGFEPPAEFGWYLASYWG